MRRAEPERRSLVGRGLYALQPWDRAAALRIARTYFVPEGLARGGGVQWDALRYAVCAVLYGGALGDEADRAVVMAFAEAWLNESLADPKCDFRLGGADGGSTGIALPADGGASLDAFRAAIDRMGEADPPSLLGLPAGATSP